MTSCMTNYFPVKLFKIGFVANVKWQERPDFGIWHHIFTVLIYIRNICGWKAMYTKNIEA